MCACRNTHGFRLYEQLKATSNATLDAHASGIHRVPVNWFDQDGKKYVKLGDLFSWRGAPAATHQGLSSEL